MSIRRIGARMVSGILFVLAGCSDVPIEAPLKPEPALLDTPEDAAALAIVLANMHMPPPEIHQFGSGSEPGQEGLSPRERPGDPPREYPAAGVATHDSEGSAEPVVTQCHPSGTARRWTEVRDIDTPYGPNSFELQITRYNSCHWPGEDGQSWIHDGLTEYGEAHGWFNTQEQWRYEVNKPSREIYTDEGGTTHVHLVSKRWGREDRRYAGGEAQIDERHIREASYTVQDKQTGLKRRQRAVLHKGTQEVPFTWVTSSKWEGSTVEVRLHMEGRLAYATEGPYAQNCGLGIMEVGTPVQLKRTAEGMTGQLLLTTDLHEALVTFNDDGSFTVGLDGTQHTVAAEQVPSSFCPQPWFWSQRWARPH